ncbi:FHA domain-containing protein [uncultured Microbacterium sp.]|uniref:FHA domain-containing protein n=1 Tax=uncultured Microbacterium sp. TaxID=191216 RepID=UPI0025EE6013|nr:FHA domain-containing protein [uncultured Microbacterium sp.]
MNDERAEDLTTHAEWGAGTPRLLVSSAETTQYVYEIPPAGATIGSGQDCTLTLDGADPLHAEITHDDDDEYMLVLHAEGETSANVEKAAEEQHRERVPLRTGAQFSVGPWRLVFQRDEFADHGRPFGGREGGEGSDQPVQDARPSYAQGPRSASDDAPTGSEETADGEPYAVNAQGDPVADPQPPADA